MQIEIFSSNGSFLIKEFDMQLKVRRSIERDLVFILSVENLWW